MGADLPDWAKGLFQSNSMLRPSFHPRWLRELKHASGAFVDRIEKL
jgi:hypothetical protein